MYRQEAYEWCEVAQGSVKLPYNYLSSHQINSHEINSHTINSHQINSHEVIKIQ